MGKVTNWVLGQPLVWLLVLAVLYPVVVSVRRDGAVLAAHRAGIVAGASAGGPGRGLAQAGSDLSAWWGVEAADAGQYVEVIEEPQRRSVLVRVRGAMRVLLGRVASLGAGSFQRLEEFYPGPAAEDGWE